MSNDSSFQFILGQFIYQAPMLFVCGVGLVAAMIHWQRFPRAAMLAAGGLVLWPVTSLVTAALSQFVLMQSGRSGGVPMYNLFPAINLASSILHAIAMAMIVWAIFANRSASFSPDHFPSKPFA